MRFGALAAALVAGAGILLAPATALREAGTDALIQAWPRPDAPAPVLAVAIGEADLAELGPWPWPRATLARIAARLAEDGAAAVALDVSLVEAGEGDAALEESLSVVAVLEGSLPAPRSFPVAMLGAPVLTGLPILHGVEPQPLRNIPAGLAALPGGTVRSVPMLVRLATPGEPVLPGLALASLAAALRVETVLLRAGSPVLIQLGRAGLTLPPDGLLRLDPPRRPVPRVSAAAVLRGEASEMVRGRVAIIGVTAAEVAPLRPSLLGPFTPALHIQAEAVAQLASGWVPLRLRGGAWTEAALGLLLGLLAAFAVSRAPGRGVLLTLLLGLAWPMAALASLRWGATLVDPVMPAVAVLAGGFVEAAATARRLARERARLLSRFAHRLPTGVADQLLALPEAERLRPELVHVAVVMTDLAGFSAMVRAGEPAAVVATLNAYLAGIEAAVLAQGGTLERLIGDSVLAVFGAPVPRGDHAVRALAAARGIDDFAEDFRRRSDAQALGWGETRIGVTAGEVLAGEVGGSRLTWSVCGDAANVAARLQELGKSLGRRALVAGIEDPSLPPPVGRFELRGLAGEVEVRPLS